MLDGLKELHSENASIQQLFNPLLLNGRPVGDLVSCENSSLFVDFFFLLLTD